MHRPRQQQGFSLIEVILALAIATFCLVAILGLIPVGLKNNRSSVQELQSVNIINYIAADLNNSNQNNIRILTSGTGAPVSTNSQLLQIPLTPTPGSTTTLFFDNDASPLDGASNSMYRVVISGSSQPLISGALTVNSFNIGVIWPATGIQQGRIDACITLTPYPNPTP